MADVTIAGAATATTTPLPVANTIDAVNDYVPIYTASATATQAINRNTFLGITAQPVGTTSIQTITNKTITAPAISSPVLSGTVTGTYTIGGTPTFPASVVTLTGIQTLTNKTFTSPTINSGTIDNATITVDSIAGHTSATLGTVYGLSISAGVLNTNNSVKTSNYQNASVTADKLATGAQAGTVLTAETTTSTAYTDLATTTDSVTATVGANGILLVSIYSSLLNSGANAGFVSYVLSGANTQAATDTYALVAVGTNQSNYGATFQVTGLTPGSTTVKMKYRVVAGTGTFSARRVSAVPL